MHVRNLVRQAYEVIAPYVGIASVEDNLLKNSFLVVMEEGKFFGVLTPSDILERPHRLVIDCLRDKPRVDYEFKTESILRLMKENGTSVLPVFKGDELVGVVTQDDITDYLVEYRKDLQQEVAERTAEQTRAIEKLEQEIIRRERAEAEAKARQEQLIQAAKMASLGTLVAGVAHEINNPNQFIMLNASILKKSWDRIAPIVDKYYKEKGNFSVGRTSYGEMREEVSDMLQDVSKASERIKTIVEGLKDFARLNSGSDGKQLNINTIADASIQLMSGRIRSSTKRFKSDFEKGLPTIKGDFQRLEQVIVNLIQNSCEAIDDVEKGIFISTYYNKDKGSLMLEVRDEGEGISEDDLRRAYDPFFTTKRGSGGTGLGLSISSTIVRDHGGELLLDSSPGKGTIATVVLPVFRADAKNGKTDSL